MDETKINAMLQALEQQRNTQANEVVRLAAELAVAKAKIAELENDEE